MEQKIIGYTRDREKGKVIGYHLKDISNTLHTGGGTTAQYVLEIYNDEEKRSVPDRERKEYSRFKNQAPYRVFCPCGISPTVITPSGGAYASNLR
jgi:hypothetical protein